MMEAKSILLQDKKMPLASVSQDSLVKAASRACEWLIQQADNNFPDTTHHLSFPKRLGFWVKTETQSSDYFARATLANLLLDCAEIECDSSAKAKLQRVACQEAEYLAKVKLSDRAGGWSYFPGLPELPPDADSLSTIATLFMRVAQHHLPLLERPLELLLGQQRDDGFFSTWLIAPEDPKTLQRRMRRGIKHHWRREFDTDVLANIIYALNAIDSEKYSMAIASARKGLQRSQNADGTWPATWYWHHGWPAWLCLRVFSKEKYASLHRTSCDQLTTLQNADGGWGPWQTVPLETALVVYLLAEHHLDQHQQSIHVGVHKLLEMQMPEGHWEGTSWIRMPVPGGKSLSWGSHCITTAVALRTLLYLIRARNEN